MVVGHGQPISTTKEMVTMRQSASERLGFLYPAKDCQVHIHLGIQHAYAHQHWGLLVWKFVLDSLLCIIHVTVFI